MDQLIKWFGNSLSSRISGLGLHIKRAGYRRWPLVQNMRVDHGFFLHFCVQEVPELFCSIRIVALFKGIPNLIQQFRLVRHLTPPLGLCKLLLSQYIIDKQIFSHFDSLIESFGQNERYKRVRRKRFEN